METLNEALKIAAMDIAVADTRVPPGLRNDAQDGAEDEIGGEANNNKPGLTPTDSDTASDRSVYSAAGGNGSEGSESRKSRMGDQGGAPPPLSRAPPGGGRIYVLQDGTFQTQ